jgi:hypothetical protein
VQRRNKIQETRIDGNMASRQCEGRNCNVMIMTNFHIRGVHERTEIAEFLEPDLSSPPETMILDTVFRVEPEDAPQKPRSIVQCA